MNDTNKKIEEFIKDQKPLENEFAEVLFENLWDLYEETPMTENEKEYTLTATTIPIDQAKEYKLSIINPIGDIVIYTQDYKKVFKPKEDITAYELSHIMHLLFICSVNIRASYDVDGFVKKHKLERHFEEKLDFSVKCSKIVLWLKSRDKQCHKKLNF